MNPAANRVGFAQRTAPRVEKPAPDGMISRTASGSHYPSAASIRRRPVGCCRCCARRAAFPRTISARSVSRTEETHVELAPSCVTQFLETVGPDRVLERTVRGDPDGWSAGRCPAPGVAASPPPAAKKPYNGRPQAPGTLRPGHTQASPEKAESAPPQVKPAAREPYSKPTVAREPYRKPKDAGNSRPARNDDGPGKPRAKAPYKKPKSDEPFRKPQGDQPYRKSKGAGPARDQNGPKPKGKKTATDPVFPAKSRPRTT